MNRSIDRGVCKAGDNATRRNSWEEWTEVLWKAGECVCRTPGPAKWSLERQVSERRSRLAPVHTQVDPKTRYPLQTLQMRSSPEMNNGDEASARFWNSGKFRHWNEVLLFRGVLNNNRIILSQLFMWNSHKVRTVRYLVRYHLYIWFPVRYKNMQVIYCVCVHTHVFISLWGPNFSTI